jgi:hypothetical protein
VPDPQKRFEVLPSTRGAEVSSEIMDDLTKGGAVADQGAEVEVVNWGPGETAQSNSED